MEAHQANTIALKTQAALHEENLRLINELREIKMAEKMAPISFLNRGANRHLREDSESLTPYDSHSQAPSRASSPATSSTLPFHQPASRPERYPATVLWSLEDSKKDHDVNTSNGNKSRPSMRRSIRTATGNLISGGEWTAIKSPSRAVTATLLNIQFSRAEVARSKTKSFFASYYGSEWKAVIMRLEKEQPLLRLCSNHWKAEHVLSNSLSGSSRADSESTIVNTPSIASASGNRKRTSVDSAASSTTKKQRSDAVTEQAIRNLHTTPANTGNAASLKKADTTAIGTASSSSAAVRPGLLGTATFSRRPPSSNLQPLVGSGVLQQASKPQLASLSCRDLLRFVTILNPSAEAQATNLLDALDAYPTLTTEEPSESFMTFLVRIETADPSAFSDPDDEDQTNESWGHYQFTAGNLTCTRVIDTWRSVGSPNFACRLLAAAIHTCNTSRWLCKERVPPPLSFLSDSYLNEVIALLWSCWQSANGPIVKGKSEESNRQAHGLTSAAEPSAVASGDLESTVPNIPAVVSTTVISNKPQSGANELASSVLTARPGTDDLPAAGPPSSHELEELQSYADEPVPTTNGTLNANNNVVPPESDSEMNPLPALEVLHVSELKQWLKDHNVPFRNGAVKAELIAILAASKDRPSAEAVKHMVDKRTKKGFQNKPNSQ